MSSTNKTANYNLSQFIGTDKPAWLTDYNSDMSKIDAGIDAAKDTADAASGSASAANTAIGDLTNLQTTAKTSVVAAVNEVDTEAATAQESVNGLTTVVAANTQAINTLKSIFNLNVIKNYGVSDITITGGTLTGSGITIATDSTGSIFKLYGNFTVTPNVAAGQTMKLTLPTTGIPTESNYTVNPAGITTANNIIDNISFEVKNNSIEISLMSRGGTNICYGKMWPCIYFNTDFGDEASS